MIDAGPRVALVSSAHEVGGAEVYLMALLQALGPRLAVELFVGEDAARELMSGARDAGATVAAIAGLGRRPRIRAVAGLARGLRARPPALVHANLSDQGDGLVAIGVAQALRLPLTATLHSALPGRRPALERVSRAALGRAREVVAVSSSVGTYLAGMGVRHCVVHNGVAPSDPVPAARRELGLAADAFAVGGIGRLDRVKGWDLLCAAAPAVRERVPGAVVVVIGDGPERQRLEVLGEAAGVRFLGYRERAAGLARAFDVLVVPSRVEGFGLVAVEAMLAGVPVVAADVGGLREVLGDAGAFVPPEDPAAIAGAIAALAGDPALRADLARRGVERARARFGHERMAGETLELWQRSARMAGPWPLD